MADRQDQISINYRESINKANHLLELAESLEKISSQDIAGALQKVKLCWQGDASEVYQRKLMAMQTLAKNRAGKLREASSSLKAAAERYYKAELFAQELFRGRH